MRCLYQAGGAGSKRGSSLTMAELRWSRVWEPGYISQDRLPYAAAQAGLTLGDQRSKSPFLPYCTFRGPQQRNPAHSNYLGDPGSWQLHS